MLSAAKIDQLRSALEEVDQLLAGLADFQAYPDVLTHEDPQVQGLVERTLLGVGAARQLTSNLLAGLNVGDAAALAPEDLPAAALAGEPAESGLVSPEAIEPPLPGMIQPPANLEQILMANPTGMRELILIADHDATGLAEMEQMLTADDYRVLSVRDGFEAISVYARLWAAIDLVILDFDLPGLSGDLVFDELQAINPKVAAVVSSGFTHPAKLKQMLAQGLSGFLPKPYERERLIRQIQQVIAHRPMVGH
jgi:CheY-like chemotaxis protein